MAEFVPVEKKFYPYRDAVSILDEWIRTHADERTLKDKLTISGLSSALKAEKRSESWLLSQTCGLNRTQNRPRKKQRNQRAHLSKRGVPVRRNAATRCADSELHSLRWLK